MVLPGKYVALIEIKRIDARHFILLLKCVFDIIPPAIPPFKINIKEIDMVPIVICLDLGMDFKSRNIAAGLLGLIRILLVLMHGEQLNSDIWILRLVDSPNPLLSVDVLRLG